MSGWSQWTWSEPHKKYYCTRYNEASQQYDYRWSTPDQTQAANQSSLEQQQSPMQRAYESPRDDQAPRTPGGYSSLPSGATPQSPPGHGAYTTSPPLSGQGQDEHGSQEEEDDENRPGGHHQPQGIRRPSGSDYRPSMRPIPETPGPSNAAQGPTHIRSNSYEDRESLDSRFARVRLGSQEAFFCQGRVFMVLWSEPAGDSHPRGKSRSHYTIGWLKGHIYSEIRRFIVVANRGLYSQCIPIQTYGGQGANKPRVHIKDHTRIYAAWQGRGPPDRIGNENLYMDKQPIRMEPKNENPENEDLHSASRINFGKTYTVEHNVRVLGIGKIHKEDLHLLIHYYRIVNELT